MGRGRHSDSESDQSRSSRRKKKKRGRGRSRSLSSSDSSPRSNSRSKKSKKKRGSRRSPTPDGHSSHSRGRSPTSPDRHSNHSRGRHKESYKRSRSRSFDRRASRRSRSPVSKRRSRSKSPSYSRDRRSRSDSRGHRSKRVVRQRSKSRSASRGHDRQADSEPHGGEESRLTSSELAEARMRRALQAAAAADEKLKVAGGQGSSRPAPSQIGLTSSKDFVNSVAAIESESFVSAAFTSSRMTPQEVPREPLINSHNEAIFGSLSSAGFTIQPDPDTKPVRLDPESIMHPRLFCDPEEKMGQWIIRLSQLRSKKLEGEVMQ